MEWDLQPQALFSIKLSNVLNFLHYVRYLVHYSVVSIAKTRLWSNLFTTAVPSSRTTFRSAAIFAVGGVNTTFQQCSPVRSFLRIAPSSCDPWHSGTIGLIFRNVYLVAVAVFFPDFMFEFRIHNGALGEAYRRARLWISSHENLLSQLLSNVFV